MKTKNNLNQVLLLCLLLCCIGCSKQGQCQAADIYKDSIAFVNKINSVQIADYKPEKAKNGKHGDNRIGIRILKGGRSGGDGKDGLNGPHVQIHIAPSKVFNLFCLQVSIAVLNTNIRDTFYVNPAKGMLKIIADGGDAGDGGNGENESPSNSTGRGGSGANGGNGGSMEIIFEQFDRSSYNQPYIIFSNSGGNGGKGGVGGSYMNYSSERASGGRDGASGIMGSQKIINNEKTGN